MRLTSVNKLDIGRFGCSFLPRENLLCISWPKERKTQIAAANVVTSFFCPHTESGPLLCLGCEISPTRILAHYCWYPFDPGNSRHTKFLSEIVDTGTIRLSFIMNSYRVRRVHEISPRERKRMAELYAKTMADFKAFPISNYNFIRAAAEVEHGVRLVDLFEYVVTEKEMQRIVALSTEGAARVTVDHRAEATKIANELLEVFRPQYDSFVRGYISNIPSLKRNLLFMLDLHREFEGDYDKFAHFVADVIAAHTPKEENKRLETATLFFKSIFKLISDMKDSNSEEASSTQIESDFRDIMTRITEGQGFSIKAVMGLLSSIGFQVGGKPGRTPEDYSTEYALKAAGQTWPEVAAYTLQNDPETLDEFSGRTYGSLSFEEKELLKNRVREGTRSYAKRTGKPFPPKKVSS